MEAFREKIASILILIEACRYLAAAKEHADLLSALEGTSVSEEVRVSVKAELENNATIETMLVRASRMEHCIHFVDTSDDWILGADMFGIKTYYRKCEDDENAIVVKIDGTVDDLPLFEQMAVLHEIDLYKEWAPFCSSSVMVDKIGQAELFGYLCMGLPMFSRDFLMHAYAGDCMQEHGKVVILGHSVEEYEAKPVPWRACGWLHKRMKVQDMEAIVEALSPTAAQMKIICRVDLNAPLPHSLINFLIRKLAGVILYMIQRQAAKVQSDAQCSHALRIRSNHGFYRDWLLPKFRHYCDLRSWDQPTIVSLGADGLPPATKSTDQRAHSSETPAETPAATSTSDAASAATVANTTTTSSTISDPDAAAIELVNLTFEDKTVGATAEASDTV